MFSYFFFWYVLLVKAVYHWLAEELRYFHYFYTMDPPHAQKVRSLLTTQRGNMTYFLR